MRQHYMLHHTQQQSIPRLFIKTRPLARTSPQSASAQIHFARQGRNSFQQALNKLEDMASLTRTLPASWFCSLPLYQLERRAVFLKSWHFLGPVTRFQNRNEKVIYEIAQVKIFVENTSPEHEGIDLEGIVVRAVEGQNRKIMTHLTPSGLLFATLSLEAPPFEEYFAGLEDLTNKVDFTKLPHRRSISYEGRFNWKTMIDGYQECLHCQYTHPTFTKFYPPTFYSVTNHKNFSQHIADPSKTSDGLFLYFFPICTLNVYGGGMSSFRTLPSPDPNVSRMEFDYYHSGTEQEFEEYFKFVRQVALEDFELCEKAQENLCQGVYGEGILNPTKENGVAFYQRKVRELVYKQFEIEKSEKEEIEKARRGGVLDEKVTAVILV